MSEIYKDLWTRIEVSCQEFQKFGLFTPLPKSILPFHSEEHKVCSKRILFDLICLKLLHPFMHSHETYEHDVTMRNKYESVDAYIVGQYVQPLLLYDSLSEHEKEKMSQFFKTQT